MTTKTNVKNFKQAHLEFDLNKTLKAPSILGEMEYEVWRSIPDFEGFYECSSFGRIKSLERITERKKVGNLHLPERILKQQLSPYGYLSVGFKVKDKAKRMQTHQIVAVAFLNHTPNGFITVVDHIIANNKTDNRSSSLQLISNRENASKDKKGYTSKYVGVDWKPERNKWRSAIHINGKNLHLGYFNNEKDASRYYQEALISIEKGLPINIKKKSNTSQYKGVYKKGNKWALTIKGIYHGTFDTEKQAYQHSLKITK